MAFDYADVANEAAEIIAEFGNAGTLTQVVAGTYNPATGAVEGGTTTVTTVNCCVFDFDDAVIDGTRIISGDKRVIMAAGAIPKPDDTFTWMGTVHRVIATKQLSPAGVNVLTEMQVRR